MTGPSSISRRPLRRSRGDDQGHRRADGRRRRRRAGAHPLRVTFEQHDRACLRARPSVVRADSGGRCSGVRAGKRIHNDEDARIARQWCEMDLETASAIESLRNDLDRTRTDLGDRIAGVETSLGRQLATVEKTLRAQMRQTRDDADAAHRGSDGKRPGRCPDCCRRPRRGHRRTRSRQRQNRRAQTLRLMPPASGRPFSNDRR